MSLQAWRIVKAKHAQDAFNGEGARLYGGRWNSVGTRMVYTSATASLTVLEIMVHLNNSALIEEYVLFQVEFDESLVESLDPATLPKSWRVDPPPPMVQAIGDRWVAERRSAVLRMPSVIIPHEHNYLLNPEHPDFPHVHIGKPQPFLFDRRLKGE